MRGSAGRTTPVAVVSLVLLLAAGCRDAEESYCEALAEEEQTLAGLTEDDSGDVLAPTLESFERLRDEAPEELRDEWDTVVRAYRSLAEVVEETGVDPESYDPQDPPDGVDSAEARRLAEAAGVLQSVRVLDAARGIEDHARAVCEVDFTA